MYTAQPTARAMIATGLKPAQNAYCPVGEGSKSREYRCADAAPHSSRRSEYRTGGANATPMKARKAPKPAKNNSGINIPTSATGASVSRSTTCHGNFSI